MKKITSILLILVVVLVGSLAEFSYVRAYAPTLSVYTTGSSDSVQINVNGDVNSGVTFYYQTSGYNGYQSRYLGSTNYSGYFSTTISASSYNIPGGSSVYVIVNGQQSSSVAWPYNYYGGGGSISLSQSSVSVNVGQSVNVTISGGYSPYAMYPNSPNLYQAAIGGNTLTITGQNTGSDSLRICASGSTTSCATLYITINNNYSGSPISLNQNSVSLNVGGTMVVSIYGAGSYYYISSNSNSAIVSATISGSTMNLYGLSYGTSNITVCQSGGQCATLYVSVGSGSGSTNSAVNFSQNNIYLSTGQSTTVSVYGGSSSSYNIAYNSNTNTAQASLSGSTLTVAGLSNGAVAIVVCSAANNCGALNVSVGSIGSIAGAQNNWIYCAEEGGYCNFQGTQLVRYGANGSYYYRTVTGGTACTNYVFGDPIFGYVKQCSYGGSR